MKETTCPLCGEKIVIADETIYKQHVLCPYCNGKFSYLADSAEFSSERLAYAIATSRKNSVDSRYYSQAPTGARMYIGLLFYGRVFKGELDANLYLAAMRQVEPELKRRDWQYLLENENDPELAAYYRDRLDMARIGPDSATVLSAPKQQPSEVGTVRGEAVPQNMRQVSENGIEEIAERQRAPSARHHATKRRQRIFSYVIIAACFSAVVIVGSALAIMVLPSILPPEPNPHNMVSEPSLRPDKANKIAEDDFLTSTARTDIDSAPNNQTKEVPQRVCENPVRQEPSVSSPVILPTPVAEPRATTAQVIRKEEQEIDEPKIDDHYDVALEAFDCAFGCALQFWEDLKGGERPNILTEMWYCAIPNEREKFSLYEVGVSNRILQLTHGKQPQEVTAEGFGQDCADSAMVYANEDRIVMRGFGTNKPVPFAIPKENESLNVGALAFVGRLSFLKALGVNMSGIQYAVSVAVRHTDIEVSQLGIADYIEREPIEKAVREFLFEQKVARAMSRINLKPPRITVREYDGNEIVKYKDVTLIPAHPDYEQQLANIQCTGVRYTIWNNRVWESSRCNCDGCKRKREITKRWDKWKKLKAQATKGSLMMKEYEEKRNRLIEEKKRSIVVSEFEVQMALNCAEGSIRRITEDENSDER